MVVDSLANADLYRALGPGIAAGLQWLRDFDPARTPDGRHDIQGDDLFALVQSYDTTPGAEKRFESHEVYADIQLVAAGRERLLHTATRSLEVLEAYDPERDIAFYHEPPASSSVLLQPGDFAILFPDDAHKPGCMAGGREGVRKVVVKVKIEGR